VADGLAIAAVAVFYLSVPVAVGEVTSQQQGE
jgi:hypothetical protein